EILLKAKWIDDKAVSWIHERRAAPDGAVTVKVRQLYIPPNKPTINAWLEKEAGKIADEAEAAIKGGMKIEGAAFKWSEDESTSKGGGIRPRVTRGELLRDHGADFEDK